MIPNLSLSHAAIKSYDCHEATPIIGASLSDWALAAAADDDVSLHRKRPKPHALLLSLREGKSFRPRGASERAFSFQLFEERSHAELPLSLSLAASTFGIRRGMKRFGEIAAALLRRCLTDSIGLGRRTKREIRRRDRSIALYFSLSLLSVFGLFVDCCRGRGHARDLSYCHCQWSVTRLPPP